MKIYEFRDSVRKKRTGAYLIAGANNTPHIIIGRKAEQSLLPAYLYLMTKGQEKVLTIQQSEHFLESRTNPPERQNIKDILRANDLTEYNALKLCLLARAKCCQDDCDIIFARSEKTEEDIGVLLGKRIMSVYVLPDYRLLITFLNGQAGIVNVKTEKEEDRHFARILSSPSDFKDYFLDRDGFEIWWNPYTHIVFSELYDSAVMLPLSSGDIMAFVSENVLDTTDVTEALGCSRQNLSKNKTMPIWKKGNTSSLYSRSDVRLALTE